MAQHLFTRITPPIVSVKYYLHGELPLPADWGYGDAILVRHGPTAHKSNLLAEAIAAGQRVLAISESELKNYTWPDHVCIISDKDQNGNPVVSEFGPSGFAKRGLDGYEAEVYAIVHFDFSPEQRANILAYNASMQMVSYGFLEYPGLAIQALTLGEFSFSATFDNSVICSTHTGMCLAASGCFFPDRIYTSLAPAHLAYFFDVPTPANLKVIEEEAMTTAILVNAHAVSRQLHETVYTPTHPKRGSSSSEFRETKAALIKESPNCYICGRTAEESGSPLELHHTAVEWSLANSADLTKIQEYYPQAKSIEQFLDSVDNGTILCARCHRSPLRGVHMITFPAWVVQKYQLDNWDLVNGPNHTSMAALDNDQSGYYPEH